MGEEHTLYSWPRLARSDDLILWAGQLIDRLRSEVGGGGSTSGSGLPPGGVAGQVLTKVSAADYAASWAAGTPGPIGPQGPRVVKALLAQLDLLGLQVQRAILALRVYKESKVSKEIQGFRGQKATLVQLALRAHKDLSEQRDLKARKVFRVLLVQRDHRGRLAPA